MGFDQNFQVDLGGVIRLLSDHLYSGPEVFARELLQNAVDAITARQLIDPTHNGTIRVEVLGENTPQGPTIAVEDNGIGLTEEEVHQFLATIGQSSKAGEANRDDFIGQFGIGLLSAFVVSDEITVITQSARTEAQTVEWKGRADGTYSVRLLETQLSPGTRVYLRAKTGMQEFFVPDKVKHLLKHFGNHLPHSITLVTGEQQQSMNETPPWREFYSNNQTQQEALLQYGRDVFNTDFLDAVPLQSDRGDVAGIAFILPFAASPAARQSHRVYLKNMLLSEQVEGLLPDWAFFIRCVVNANQLRPNAARDSFYEDDALRTTREELGTCLRNYLVHMAKHDRTALDHLVRLHYLPIKALSIEDDDFFDLFIDWLPFETSTGQTTLADYTRENHTIRYVGTVDQFRQISSVANAQGLCVFNGGYVYDSDLLEKLAHRRPHQRVECVEVGELVQDFEELTLEESNEVFDLVKRADVVLQRYKCGAEVRKFVPADLPTLFTANEAASFMRSVDQSKEEVDDMWQGILDNVSQSAAASAYSQLVLNYHNPLIRKLTTVKDDFVLQRVVEILYLQSLLLGHYPLKAEELRILGTGLVGLIDHFIDQGE